MELDIPGVNINVEDKDVEGEGQMYDIIDQIFILIVMIHGGFMVKTINPKLRGMIKSDIKYSYLILFFTIFFVLKLMKEKEYHPILTLFQSIKIFTFYYVIMDLELNYLLIVLLLLLVIFLLDHYRNYHKNNKFTKINKNIIRIEYVLYSLIIITIIMNYHKLMKK